jgi:DNA-binding MarR family transcriptional regulator
VNVNESLPDQLNLAALLRIPFQMLVAELHRRLADAGYPDIRPAHSVVFAHVDTEGIRLGELAERAQLTKQLVNYLVSAIEECGYVERVPDPLDGRAKLVRLTEKGRLAGEVAGGIFQSIEREWSEAIGETRVHELRKTLEDLIANLAARGSRPAVYDAEGT